MTMRNLRRYLLTGLVGSLGVLSSQAARASNPLEYPDNGAAQFSRGGAWLATANEPIATHYNPAALATQPSGFSIEQQLNYNRVCFDRRVPGNQKIGPLQTQPDLLYTESCSERGSFPSTIPSISFVWRATAKLGFGFALVPPAAYGFPRDALSPMSEGRNRTTGETRPVPSPYRYMAMNQQSLIIFPTIGVGYELFKNFRVGAGFISGIATITTSITNITRPSTQENNPYDYAREDTRSDLRTQDLFMPGVIASIHWSMTDRIDFALWGRWIDSVRTSKGQIDVTTRVYDTSARETDICTEGPDGTIDNSCPDAFPNPFDNALQEFEYPIAPEARIGLRYHHPRADFKPLTDEELAAGALPVRDPLHDDVFDVEVNGSYTKNTSANEIKVRLDNTLQTLPEGVFLPPNADRWNGYRDSFGVRIGGQWNVLRDKLGLRVGGWMETRSQDPEWLNVFPTGPQRYGVGGGIVFRQDFIDISIGFQHHGSSALDNKGDGRMRAILATSNETELHDGPNTSAKDRVDFRTPFAINGGKVTQYANSFTLGGTVRF